MSNKHNNYIIFDEYKTNRPGAWYFVPDEGVFVKGVPCHGFGAVKYVEGSVYVGELYYGNVEGETRLTVWSQVIAE